MPPLLAATDVSLSFNNQVLDNATLGISEADRIGLVGRNGCGKTTFCKVLAGCNRRMQRHCQAAARLGREL